MAHDTERAVTAGLLVEEYRAAARELAAVQPVMIAARKRYRAAQHAIKDVVERLARAQVQAAHPDWFNSKGGIRRLPDRQQNRQRESAVYGALRERGEALSEALGFSAVAPEMVDIFGELEYYDSIPRPDVEGSLVAHDDP